MDQFINIFLHLDQHLNQLIQTFGLWTYVILFLIMFLETGLIVVPFLPGDSLLFAAGSIAAMGGLDVHWLAILLLIAAVLGDGVNYFLGLWVGPKVFQKEDSFLFKKAYLEKAHTFYEKHGGIAIVLARFIPIIRSFAPFIAGVASMNLRSFTFYNVMGGFVWVYALTYLGYFFGNLPIIKAHFSWVVIAIIIVSVVPMGIGLLKAYFCRKNV